jgi:pilus assembly protein Flp/PilA
MRSHKASEVTQSVIHPPFDTDTDAEEPEARDGERGQGLVEYGLILILVAVAVIIVLGLIGHQLNNVFSNVSSGLAH